LGTVPHMTRLLGLLLEFFPRYPHGPFFCVSLPSSPFTAFFRISVGPFSSVKSEGLERLPSLVPSPPPQVFKKGVLTFPS